MFLKNFRFLDSKMFGKFWTFWGFSKNQFFRIFFGKNRKIENHEFSKIFWKNSKIEKFQNFQKFRILLLLLITFLPLKNAETKPIGRKCYDKKSGLPKTRQWVNPYSQLRGRTHVSVTYFFHKQFTFTRAELVSTSFFRHTFGAPSSAELVLVIFWIHHKGEGLL